ncbi:MAG: adenylate kinase [Clostridiales bacterium]|nr:MAG: adenylate kinase [Clostridiales bacterium]
MLNLILLGAPGAGKGTQAVMISERYGIPQISTGAILREAIADKTPLGIKVESVIKAGDLVADDDVVAIVRDRLKKDDCKNGFIMDGFPRTIPQAEAFDKMLKESGIEISKVISIEVKDDDIVSRMSGRRVCPICGASYHTVFSKPKVDEKCDKCFADLQIRADDKPEVVLERLQVYHKQTAPLKDYYQKTGKLVLVEGQPEIKDTTELVNKALEA